MSETKPSFWSRNLTKLPEEVIERIIFLTSTSGRRNLAVTSKLLCRLATPALYGDIEWILRKEARLDLKLDLLLRTLSQRPELAAAIKNVNIETEKNYNSAMSRFEPVTRDVEAELELLHTLEFNLGSSLVALYRSPPRRLQTVDGQIALLLILARNIRALRLGLGLLTYQSVVSRVIEKALTNETTMHPILRFNSLRHIELPPDFTEGSQIFPSRSVTDLNSDIAYQTCLACFYGPAVEFISVSFPEPDRFSWLGEPPVASKLQSLVLHHSEAKEDTLRELLSVTPNLKKLIYNFWCEVDSPRGKSEYLTCSKLHRALDQVSYTLVQLVISVNFYTFAAVDINEDGPFGLEGCIGSLSHFKQLKHLDMPLVVLLGWSPKTAQSLRHVLPRSLRTLCLTDGMSHFESWEWSVADAVAQVRDTLVNWKNGFPDLQSINVRAEHWGQGWNTNLKPQIMSLCDEAGLRGDL